MEKFKSFFTQNGYMVISFFMLFLLMQTCNQNSNIKSLKKEVKVLEIKNDSLVTQLRNEIKIEGLKAEKRMIQATDRKLMDVQRQFAIEEEIKKLENNN